VTDTWECQTLEKDTVRGIRLESRTAPVRNGHSTGLFVIFSSRYLFPVQDLQMNKSASHELAQQFSILDDIQCISNVFYQHMLAIFTAGTRLRCQRNDII